MTSRILYLADTVPISELGYTGLFADVLPKEGMQEAVVQAVAHKLEDLAIGSISMSHLTIGWPLIVAQADSMQLPPRAWCARPNIVTSFASSMPKSSQWSRSGSRPRSTAIQSRGSRRSVLVRRPRRRLRQSYRIGVAWCLLLQVMVCEQDVSSDGRRRTVGSLSSASLRPTLSFLNMSTVRLPSNPLR